MILSRHRESHFVVNFLYAFIITHVWTFYSFLPTYTQFFAHVYTVFCPRIHSFLPTLNSVKPY
uniref:Uncharacterized protein n=1 Tax=Lactococcus lactis subsp. cremoris TaxID=1359 RepID=A0A1V0PE34_LACLC